MKRLLKLTINEVKHLKWTVLVAAVALVLFTAALFSVIFVYNDLSFNVFNYFDTTDYSALCAVRNVSVSDVGNLDSDLYYGRITGITDSGTVIEADNGNTFNTYHEIREEVDGVTVITTRAYSGIALYVNGKYREKYSDLMSNVALPQNEGEILLDGFIADSLQVEIGDKVTIGGNSFTVCGTYDYDQSMGSYDICYPFVISVDGNAVFDYMYIKCDSSYQIYLQCLKFQRDGIDAEYGLSLQFYLDNLSLVNGFLIAIAITVFVVNLLLLYAVFSMILNSRRSYVCRLKVMGATDGLVFASYYIIIAILLIVICVAAFFLSKVMVASVMESCSQAFESVFTTRTNFGVAGIYFAIVFVLLGALCYFSVRKIDDKAVVSVTRSD